MWIVPKSLPSSFASDTGAFISDSSALSLACASSLRARSKVLPAPIWLRRWKRGCSTRLLCGRTLSPSHTSGFTDWWTSSLRASRASPIPLPGNGREATMSGSSSTCSSMGSPGCDPDSSSSRTSPASSRAGCQMDLFASGTSSTDWRKSDTAWQTVRAALRSAYSARRKSAPPIGGSGSTSWPTALARDWKDCSSASSERDGNPRGRMTLALAVLDRGRRAPANGNSPGNPPASWITPYGFMGGAGNPNYGGGGEFAKQVKQWATPRAEHDSGRHRGKPDTLHSQAKEPLWMTPTAVQAGNRIRPGTSLSGRMPDGTKRQVGLENQIRAWTTPMAGDESEAMGRRPSRVLTNRTTEHLHRQVNTDSGKLNPRWVETLMGLPLGWTCPECPASVIRSWGRFVAGWPYPPTGSMSCASAETASCPPPPPWPFGPWERN